MANFEETVANLKAIRLRKDLKLRKNKYLKETFTDFAGQERPLSLRYYQVQGAIHLIKMKRFVLGDGCGLGKTIQGIAALCFLWEANPNQKAIVLTTKSATKQWAGEFVKFTTGIKTFICQGTADQRERARTAFLAAEGPSVLIMGYRSMVQDFKKYQNLKDFVLIADEATAFKNPKTQVHQVCNYLAQNADRVWGLSATIIKNHLMEGYGIFRVIQPDLFRMTHDAFMYYYCMTRLQSVPNSRRQIPIIIGYSPDKIAEFKSQIEPFFLGREKHEVATDLPTLTSKTIEVDCSPPQADKYEEALNGVLEMTVNGEATVKEVNKLSAISYCQEIVDSLNLIGCEGESAKLEALVELVTSGDFEDEKIIVFSRFEKMVSLIMERLKKEKVSAVRITGKENQEARMKAMATFQNPDSDVRVICITTAGSEAINLQAAKAFVCVDTPWSAGEFLQLLGRMIRIGSVHDKCYVVHLVARANGKKTVDHRILEVLGNKMALVEGILGKRIKGENDMDTPLEVESSSVSDLWATLKTDAKERKTK